MGTTSADLFLSPEDKWSMTLTLLGIKAVEDLGIGFLLAFWQPFPGGLLAAPGEVEWLRRLMLVLFCPLSSARIGFILTLLAFLCCLSAAEIDFRREVRAETISRERGEKKV